MVIFTSDRGVVGRTVEINKHPFTIIGVAPPGFRGTELFFAPAMWIPMVEQPTVQGYNALKYRGNHSGFVVGRLKPGVTREQATADLNTIGAWLAKAYPAEDDGVKFTLARPGLIGDMLGGPARAFMAGLMLLAGLILLAACANLGSLFAARAADRAKEVALRLALGSRRRTDPAATADGSGDGFAGRGSGGTGRRRGGPALAERVAADSECADQRAGESGCVHLCGGAGAGAGEWIAFRYGAGAAGAARRSVAGDSHGGQVARGLRRFTLRDVLLVVQIAICAVLVTSSLVAVRGLVRSMHSNFGFVPQNVMLAEHRSAHGRATPTTGSCRCSGACWMRLRRFRA